MKINFFDIDDYVVDDGENEATVDWTIIAEEGNLTISGIPENVMNEIEYYLNIF